MLEEIVQPPVIDGNKPTQDGIEPKVPVAPEVKPPEVEKPKEVPVDVRGLNKVMQENAKLRKMVASIDQKLGTLQPQQQNSNQISDEQKRFLEEKYGVPIGQINLQNDLLDIKLKKLSDLESRLDEVTSTIYEEKGERVKDSFSKDEIFQHFAPEIEERLQDLTPKQRASRAEIDRIRREVINENFDVVLKMAEERGRKSVQAAPPAMPDVNRVSGGSPNGAPRVSALTPEQVQAARNMGLDPDAVGNFVSGKAKSGSGWSSHTK